MLELQAYGSGSDSDGHSDSESTALHLKPLDAPLKTKIVALCAAPNVVPLVNLITLHTVIPRSVSVCLF